jgi:hypothetical protein
MKRFTFPELVICCALSVLLTGICFVVEPFATCDVFRLVTRKAGSYEKGRDSQGKILAGQAERLDNKLTAYLLEKSDYYRNLPAQDVQKKRLADQAKILQEYEKDPAAFVNKYRDPDRIYLFDAVIDGKNLLRVGRFGDGGKWLSNSQSLKPGAVVYSFGVGDDISFDVEMAGLFGSEVHAFDPTPSVVRSFRNYQPGQAVGQGKFWYHPVGLGPV